MITIEAVRKQAEINGVLLSFEKPDAVDLEWVAVWLDSVEEGYVQHVEPPDGLYVFHPGIGLTGYDYLLSDCNTARWCYTHPLGIVCHSIPRDQVFPSGKAEQYSMLRDQFFRIDRSEQDLPQWRKRKLCVDPKRVGWQVPCECISTPLERIF